MSSVHRAFDNRIFYKESKTLIKAGYEVTLIAQHPKSEYNAGVKIISLPRPKNRFFRMTLVPFLVLRLALKEKASVYHFHDPELIPVCIFLRAFSGKVIIYDVHENVPLQIMNKRWLGIVFIRKCISILFTIFQNMSFLFLNYYIAATPDIEKTLPKKKTMLLRNFPILNKSSEIVNSNHDKIVKKNPIIIYVGGLTRIRGISEIVKAMGYIKDKAELWLLGPWEGMEFKQECEALDGWQYTQYHGFVNPDEVFEYLKKADIGIINFLPFPNHLTSLPNKPFEYMACNLPVVMSNFSYWKVLFKSCALFVDPEDPEDIAEKIDYLLHNEEMRVKLGKEGKRLVEREYRWEIESKKLLNLYKSLSKSLYSRTTDN